jgi:hypothetical protein
MLLKIRMELLPEDRQPKNSYRYGFKNGDAGIESVYIKRSVFKGAPPKNITVSVDEAD